MFEFIMESERVEAKKDNVITLMTDTTRYILLIDNLIEFDITNQINSTFEINFKNVGEISTINITLKDGECLYNIPFKTRRKEQVGRES